MQIIKHQSGNRLEQVEIRYTHGSQKRIAPALKGLGYYISNTLAIEWRNGTARLMSSAQVCKMLAFVGKASMKEALGWWRMTVYNWPRPHRSLKQLLPEPVVKNSIDKGYQLWPSV